MQAQVPTEIQSSTSTVGRGDGVVGQHLAPHLLLISLNAYGSLLLLTSLNVYGSLLIRLNEYGCSGPCLKMTPTVLSIKSK